MAASIKGCLATEISNEHGTRQTHVAPVERADIDHCYYGWGRAAYVTWPDEPQALEISASPELTHAVVYSSAALEEFCFEPVAHMNDALNRRNSRFPMPVVAPGESFSAGITFSALER